MSPLPILLYSLEDISSARLRSIGAWCADTRPTPPLLLLLFWLEELELGFQVVFGMGGRDIEEEDEDWCVSVGFLACLAEDSE